MEKHRQGQCFKKPAGFNKTKQKDENDQFPAMKRNKNFFVDLEIINFKKLFRIEINPNRHPIVKQVVQVDSKADD